ncbi:hypothetical protein BGZ95_002425 [Linnemannia exigua]|uniref:G-protein coupled receptors family 2 profile 2 domain-containing protein n=1 Tax=Linnemannia exigua TaxID=604196 RepID=A0AAD4D5J9_9FUNG|nr:hypothetical protein BGZ95_002425 [Linnemannia exigua]
MYRSINYTLQIFCAVAIFNNINESFLLLRYGENVMSRAHGTPGCIFSAVFEQFIPLAVSSLATCMGFNIWYLIVMRSKHTEKEMLKWYCLYSFGMPLVVTSVALILLRNQPFLSSYPRKYYCDLGGTNITYWTFAVPMLITAILGILCAVHTVFYLLRHYLVLRRTLNSGTYSNGGGMSFELGYCIRLLIFCIGFGVLVLMAVLDTIVDPNARKATYNTSEDLSNFSDFSGSLVGIVIFVIFGTTRDAFRTFKKITVFVFTCGRDRGDSVDLGGGGGRGAVGRSDRTGAGAGAGAGGRRGDWKSIGRVFGRGTSGSGSGHQWDWKGIFGRFGRRSSGGARTGAGTRTGAGVIIGHQRVRSESTNPMAYSVSTANGSAGSGFGGGSQGTLGASVDGKQELVENGPVSFNEIILGAYNIINTNESHGNVTNGNVNDNGNGIVMSNITMRPVLRGDYDLESGYPPVAVLPPPPPLPPKPSPSSSLPVPASAPGTRLSSPPSFGNSGGGGQPMWQQYGAAAANQAPAPMMVRPSSFSAPSPPPQSYFPRR